MVSRSGSVRPRTDDELRRRPSPSDVRGRRIGMRAALSRALVSLHGCPPAGYNSESSWLREAHLSVRLLLLSWPQSLRQLGRSEGLSCHPSAHTDVDFEESLPASSHFRATVQCGDHSRSHKPAQEHHFDIFALLVLPGDQDALSVISLAGCTPVPSLSSVLPRHAGESFPVVIVHLCGQLNSIFSINSNSHIPPLPALAPHRVSFPAVVAATCGRRSGVPEADCRGGGRLSCASFESHGHCGIAVLCIKCHASPGALFTQICLFQRANGHTSS